MACAGCSVKTQDGEPLGCRNNGNCSTGGCNRLNTYDWLTTMELQDVEEYEFVEVSFKNGARKGFYRNTASPRPITGDRVVVETSSGHDVGTITLSGELVRLQMKRKKVRLDSIAQTVIRRANERDLERLQEAREREVPTMVRARAIARTLGLDMKVGDVEYQGDKRKATFYYTADGRVDFRELIRHYAKEFRVKIEMRQIGARQESARIGGLGSCGRELCCSTWLTDFKSVSTAAARYQNLAINQAKLSGQCGRLKCCLNYELDTYIEALDQFPDDAEKLKTQVGTAVLIKTDIFKKLMYYTYTHENGRGKVYAVDLARAVAVKAMNDRGEFPADLIDLQDLPVDATPKVDFESVNDVIELPPEERKKGRRRNRNKNRKRPPREGGGSSENKGGNAENRSRNRNRNRNKKKKP
ncbi:MAG: hypothetical protein KDC43_06325 [Saprospiraceae bacterium]|nr:hypothetical protein [Saprospiraceae bacterium]MCB0676669.1 hypothetical protein [Saprospiraceae bacterium]